MRGASSGECGARDSPPPHPSFLLEGRQLCAIIGDENRKQARWVIAVMP
jgi:hypothetical protein